MWIDEWVPATGTPLLTQRDAEVSGSTCGTAPARLYEQPSAVAPCARSLPARSGRLALTGVSARTCSTGEQRPNTVPATPGRSDHFLSISRSCGCRPTRHFRGLCRRPRPQRPAATPAPRLRTSCSFAPPSAPSDRRSRDVTSSTPQFAIILCPVCGILFGQGPA
jgi:hypothetical protein